MRRLALLLIPALILATTTLASAQGTPTVTVRESPQLGRYLADAKGMTLYLFKNDKPNLSNCYDQCAQRWPIFEPTANLTLPAGVQGKLATIERRDGKRQVTYNGIPLYYWYQDQAPGETKGQGVGNVWYVIAPGATEAALTAPAPATPAPASAAPAPAAQLPRTGGPELPMAAAALAGLATLAGGLALRRR